MRVFGIGSGGCGPVGACDVGAKKGHFWREKSNLFHFTDKRRKVVK